MKIYVVDREKQIIKKMKFLEAKKYLKGKPHWVNSIMVWK